MTIVTDKINNRVMHIGVKIGELENGYPLFEGSMAYVTDQVILSEVQDEKIPAEVMADPINYCYINNEFQEFVPEPESPNNKYGVDEDTYNAIIDDYTLDLMEIGLL